MDNTSMQIYTLLGKEKKLSELYLGHLSYTWEYMTAEYAADCTEALPLTLLDKTICGVLDLDGEMSFGTLGAILGLNVDDEPEGSEFCDAAEYDLLQKGIQSLVEYNMVERVFSSGTIKLTDIGREYYRKGKKFRTTEAESFTVFFDMTTGVHSKASKIFGNIMGRPSTTIVPEYMKNEQFLKAFIHDQIPEIYDTEKGNSFTNLRSPSVGKTIKVPVKIGILYDVTARSFRFIAVLEEKINRGLTEIISFDKKLQEELVSIELSELAIKNAISAPKEDTAVQDSFEASFNKDTSESGTDNGVVVPPVIELEGFWQGLPLLVGDNDDCVFIRAGKIGSDERYAISTLCENRPHTNVFVCFTEIDENLPFKPNLFWMQNDIFRDFICCMPSATYSLRGYHLLGREIATEMVYRYPEASFDKDNLMGEFATVLLPMYYQRAINYLDTDFDISRRSVMNISNCDSQIMVFRDYINGAMLEALNQKKQTVYNRVKLAFEQVLLKKLDTIKAEKDLEDISKVKELEEFAGKVDEVLHDGDETFINLMEKGREFKQAIRDRERAIKDELLSKTFVIDTNVFLNDPDILTKIKRPNRVILSGQVLQELDKKKLKSEDPSVSASARKAVTAINAMKEKDRKAKKKFLLFDYGDLSLLPEELQVKKGDNFILSVAVKNRDNNPWLLTSDNIFALTAESVGIPAIKLEDFYVKNGLENPKKKDEAEAKAAPKTYMDVWESIYNEKGYVLLAKFEKLCRKAGITPATLDVDTFEEFVQAAPELTLSTNAKGTTYVNLIH